MPRALRAAAICFAGPVALAGGGEASAQGQVSSSMPAGFADLDQARRLVVDTYFAGQRVGQFEVRVDAATVQFLQPEQLIAAIPDAADPVVLQTALTGPLDSHLRHACHDDGTPCERPTPDTAAIVYDAARFRIDVYINPRLLKVHADEENRFLRPFSNALSIVDSIGVAVAGGGAAPLSYNVRNRFVASLGAGRLLSEASYSSSGGLEADTFTAQLDHGDLRYNAGFFYFSGPDLIGRRRILGLGVGTQFDTRADREAMSGTPLIVFLAQRSRVDLYVQGRLVSSYTFEAGNQRLDTSGLPDGSYAVELRIQEAAGATRTEQRFFTKSATLAPPGRIMWYADAGLMARERINGGFSASRLPLLAAGIAGRAGTYLAWDGALVATDSKILSEVGASLLTTGIRARVAVLGSTQGDYGIVTQFGSAGAGRFNYNLDLRRVRSSAGGSLLPIGDAIAEDAESIGGVESQRQTAGNSSYTQLIGNLSYHVARAHLGVSAYYRSGAGARTYAVGPTVRWTIFERNRLSLFANANYAETDRGRALAVGLQLQLLRQRSSLSAALGVQTNGDNRRYLDQVAEISGSIQRDRVLGGDLAGSASLQHSGRGNMVQGVADLRGGAGAVSLSAVERIGGSNAGGQFGLTAQTAFALGHGRVRVGARDQNDGILSVSVKGNVQNARFEVLVDDVVRGTIDPNGHMTIAVTPYRRYKVMIRATGSELVALDTQVRTIDMYPGTFAPLDWKVTSVLAMFGRLVDPRGVPIANADITAGDAIAATDDHGFFQLQAASDAKITVNRANDAACWATLNAKRSLQGYTSLGDVTCTP